MSNAALQKTNPPTQTLRPGALAVMASRVQVEPAKLLNSLKDTVFKGASESELLALVVVANEYGLNPFVREIYAFPDRKRGGIVPLVPIDGWVSIVSRQPTFDGVEFAFEFAEDGKPIACTCTMHLKGKGRPVVVTEYLEECYRNTDPWNNMPRRMLRHKAYMQAARLAFGLSGIHDQDEAIDISGVSAEQADKLLGAPVVPIEKTTRKVVETEVVPPATDEMKPAEAGNGVDPAKALAEVMSDNGVSFDDLRDFLKVTGRLKDADSIASYDELPVAIAQAVLDDPKLLNKVVKTYGKKGNE